MTVAESSGADDIVRLGDFDALTAWYEGECTQGAEAAASMSSRGVRAAAPASLGYIAGLLLQAAHSGARIETLPWRECLVRSGEVSSLLEPQTLSMVLQVVTMPGQGLAEDPDAMAAAVKLCARGLVGGWMVSELAEGAVEMLRDEHGANAMDGFGVWSRLIAVGFDVVAADQAEDLPE